MSNYVNCRACGRLSNRAGENTDKLCSGCARFEPAAQLENRSRLLLVAKDRQFPLINMLAALAKLPKDTVIDGIRELDGEITVRLLSKDWPVIPPGHQIPYLTTEVEISKEQLEETKRRLWNPLEPGEKIVAPGGQHKIFPQDLAEQLRHAVHSGGGMVDYVGKPRSVSFAEPDRAKCICDMAYTGLKSHRLGCPAKV